MEKPIKVFRYFHSQRAESPLDLDALLHLLMNQQVLARVLDSKEVELFDPEIKGEKGPDSFLVKEGWAELIPGLLEEKRRQIECAVNQRLQEIMADLMQEVNRGGKWPEKFAGLIRCLSLVQLLFQRDKHSRLGLGGQSLKATEILSSQAREKLQKVIEEARLEVLRSLFLSFQKQINQEEFSRLLHGLNEALSGLPKKDREPNFALEGETKVLLESAGIADPEEFLSRVMEEIDLLNSLMGDSDEETAASFRQLLKGMGEPNFVRELQQFSRLLKEWASQQIRPEESSPHRALMTGKDPLVELGLLSMLNKSALVSELRMAFRLDRCGTESSEATGPAGDLMAGEGPYQSKVSLDEMAPKAATRRPRENEEKMMLSPREITRLGQKALRDIFSSLKRSSNGQAETAIPGGRFTSACQSAGEETKKWEEGDFLHLDLWGTFWNALGRGLGTPINLAREDIQVYRPTLFAAAATVMMLDMSGSMELGDKFTAAKRAALALGHLIRTRFPRDDFKVVGFSTLAEEIDHKRLPYIKPRHFDYNSLVTRFESENALGGIELSAEASGALSRKVEVPQAFTNLQEGLKMARVLLSKARTPNKQIILISDGEPSAFIAEGTLFLEYPPGPRVLVETLKEVKACTKAGIRINVFMLGQDYFQKEFVHRLGRINKGRVLFARPEKLGEYVLMDFLAGKEKRVN